MQRVLVLTALSAHAARHETLFNDGWLFYEGDLPFACSTPASAAILPINLNNTFVRGLVTSAAGNASAAACAAVCSTDCACQAWQYCAQLSGPTTCASSAVGARADCTFPRDMAGLQCSGLRAVSAATADACAAACCADETCELYQFCDGSAGNKCGPAGSCWIGAMPDSCTPESGWVSRARNVTLGAQCQVGLLADYGPGSWQTSDAANWVGAARLAPPAPPTQTSGPGAVDFDESIFERIALPHDYLARGTPTNVNATAHQNEHGSIPFADAWYRKHFAVDANTTLARVYFDGAYRSASIFLNGALAAQHEEGYTGFSVWLHNVSGAPLLRGGADNVLAVHLASTIYTFELWGYEGSGIVRDVTLVLHDASVSILPWSVFAPATVIGAVSAPGGADGPLSADARVAPAVDIANAGAAAVDAIITCTVLAPGGAVVGQTNASQSLASGGWARVTPPPIALSAASLWMPASTPDAPPRPLYSLVTTVTVGGVDVDSDATTFGVRSVVFDADKGLSINGFPVKLRGLSIHENFGGLGSSVPPRIQEFRVQRALDIGANAWRCAHNPVDSRLLDATDARGLVVWEENRFLRDFDQYVKDAGDMILRDRNRPSIILWSLCNENGCGEDFGQEGAPAGEMAGAMLATRFMNYMTAIDPTRPITSNAHFTLGQNGSIQSVLPVIGLTYDYASLDKLHAGRPDAPVLNGESASCQSDRADSDASGVIACSQSSWAPAAARIWDAGAFVWSGFDYRGETSWPDVISFYGVLDYCGFDKPVAQWYKAYWGRDAGWANSSSYVEASPAWAATAGETVTITGLAAAASLQLTVNGVTVGAREPVADLGFATWKVQYTPGSYVVESFDAAGTRLGSFTSVTPGAPVSLRATLDWRGSAADGSLVAGGRDAALVTVAVVDVAGVVVRGARVNVTFSVSGGELRGLCNGDHAGHNPDQGLTWLPTYDGLARAVVRSPAAATGQPLRLSVTADGVVGDEVVIGVV